MSPLLLGIYSETLKNFLDLNDRNIKLFNGLAKSNEKPEYVSKIGFDHHLNIQAVSFFKNSVNELKDS